MTMCRSRSVRVSLLLLSLVLCLGFVFCLSAAPTWGQAVATGTVTGTVLDPQNAAVAGANVTLVDKSGGSPRTSTTTDTGRFVFTQIAPGNYDVNVSKQGFATAKIVNQNVSIGQELRLDINLKVGSASETVEVTATIGAELQTMNASVGQTVKGDQLLLLPNFGRDASTLATLQPATNPTGETAGANSDQNSFQLDGANNTNDMDGTMNIYTPSYASNGAPTGVMPTPVESIEEFKVNTNNQTADFNGSAGGQITMATKKGTNSFHGGLWEYYTDSNFGGANTWDNNFNGEPISSNHQNRFGGNAGGPVLPKFWGGKTYLFGEYDGRRFPNASTIGTTVPSLALRAGVVQIKTSGSPILVNLNPNPVTVAGLNGGAPIPSAVCPDQPGGTNGPCDPRNLGLSPTISQLWSKFEPLPNDPNCTGLSSNCDKLNALGYRGSVSLPQTDNFGVVRLDHDFSDKWHLMASYRYYHLYRATTSEVDWGGFFPGDTFGKPTAVTNRPQVPSIVIAGLTTNVSSNVTNDFHFSYLRNFWQWLGPGIPPQLAGLGNTLELGGETSTGVTQPYNVNNQSTRVRFWDGQDKMVRDDVSWLKGNHLFQFGGLYERNYDQHQRNDNGGTIQDSPFPVAISSTIGSTALCFSSCGAGSDQTYIPAAAAGLSTTRYRQYYAEALGIISQTQEVFPRVGPQLNLQPGGTPALEQSIIPTYNLYATDTWHMKPTFTLTYGLGYQIEMPPYELNGKQVIMVDQNDFPFTVQQFLQRTFTAGVNGQVYNPIIGMATIRNVATSQPGGGVMKYPYDPFYKGFSPRVSFAWNPTYDQGIMGHLFGHGKTVIRGGYSRLYGRLNGVDLVLVPLLGTGLLQATTCQGPQINGSCGGATPLTSFRIGKDGNTAPLGPLPSATLPQPFFPGVNGAPGGGAGEVLDPKFQPNQSDEFDLTIQRQLPGRMIVEVGYIGRRLRHEYQPIDIAAVPYMLRLNGQPFSAAWASMYTQLAGGTAPGSVTAQPFLEAALGGKTSAYCTGFSSCTAAVATKENSNIVGVANVYDIWQDLSSSSSWTQGRTMSSSPNCVNQVFSGPQGNGSTPVPVCQQFNGIGVNSSVGYGNYNGAFASLTTTNWHGLTARSSFTFGRSLGTQSTVQATSGFSVPDPWNLHNGYGPQPFDIRFIYNFAAVYQPDLFKGEHGLKRALFGGWGIAPLLTVRSGLPLEVHNSQAGGGGNLDCESFGETDCNFFSTDESAIFVSSAALATARGAGNAVHTVTVPSSGNPAGVGLNGNISAGGAGLNMFTNPVAVYNAFRAPILGIDTNGGAFQMRGLPTWNLDMTLSKDFHVTERFGLTFIAQFSNVLNHNQLSDPTLDINDPNNWGVISGQANSPRAMELGLRFHF